jgi:hypothetical protein
MVIHLGLQKKLNSHIAYAETSAKVLSRVATTKVIMLVTVWESKQPKEKVMFRKFLGVVVLSALVLSGEAKAQSVGGDPPDGVVQTGRRTFTSFEFFNDDGSDATDIEVGDVFFTNDDAVVAAAATRGVPEGYRRGCFVWLTAFGTSTIIVDSDQSNHISFWAKDIAEVVPDTDGMLLVTYQDGTMEVFDVPERFARFTLKNVAMIEVMTNGITNIDDFSYVMTGK